MDRRGFLKIFGGGLVATATMAEAGALAEFMDWMRRAPAWSFPTPHSEKLMWDEISALTLESIREQIPLFFTDTPFIELLRKRKAFNPFSGGNFLEEPFVYAPKRTVTA